MHRTPDLPYTQFLLRSARKEWNVAKALLSNLYTVKSGVKKKFVKLSEHLIRIIQDILLPLSYGL